MIVESLFCFMQKVLLFSAYINQNGSFPKPLTPREEEEYFNKFKAGDMEARDVLIRHNLRLVAHIVKKYANSCEADDLISVGSLGLIKAINTYNPNTTTQLSTYAAKCIENEILMLIRTNKKHKNTVSIEDILSFDEDDNSMVLQDIIHPDEKTFEEELHDQDIAIRLRKLLRDTLNDREYQIICLRYGFDDNPPLTQREVAERLGISRSYISRLEKKALQAMAKVVKKSDYR